MKTEKHYIIRTHSAGVWFGKLKKLDGSISIITEARRLWYWSGARSLSQLAVDGTLQPNQCKFAVVIEDEEGVYLPQTIEVLPCTQKAIDSINSVPVWKL